jgi:hypothetical protein
MSAPRCIECGRKAALATGDQVYAHRPDLNRLFYWVCVCGARVGCHKGTKKPLGNPCGPETAQARSQAHAAFDPLWKRKAELGMPKGQSRDRAYVWLASAMGLTRADCHISMMTREQSLRVVELCRPYADRVAQARAFERAANWSPRDRMADMA